MYSRAFGARSSVLLAVTLLVSALAVAVVYARELVSDRVEAAPPQELTRIESRLSQLEQRFYSIEMNIRSLEQQSRLSSVNSGRPERETEVMLLRSEVEALQRRVAELECGLVRIDERTLTPAAREARRRYEGGVGDTCRLNTGAPLRLSTRP
ncbi:MAG TPA: hypothetical protein VJS44_02960 [Pyrinomonadaceae bacterium]|nr:hypothetical protein [Pyrinomonadaceae bacterium]